MNTGKTIRLPVHAAETVRKITKEKEKGRNKGNEDMPRAELAGKLDMTEEELTRWEQIMNMQPRSLDAPLNEMDLTKTTFGDLIADAKSMVKYEGVEENVSRSLLGATLREILGDREADVMMLRLGLIDGQAKTLDAIAKIIAEATGDKEVSRERIRQLEDIATAKLRHPVTYRRIAKLLPIEKEEWKLDANCSNVGVDRIFEVPMAARGHPPADALQRQEMLREEQQRAVRICESCPVKDNCLGIAEEVKAKAGIWAGYLVTSRGKFVKP